jgi:LysM repeat protein
MSLTRILPVIVLIASLSLPTVVSAQVPVEVSDEKVVSGGNVYYMHEVQKNQTLYSISRAYRVSIDVISRENVIPSNGIQTGQVLRIPATDRPDTAPTQPRPVAQQAAAPTQPRPDQPSPRTAQGTSAAVSSANSGIRISGEKIISSGRTFYLHEIQKGETLYSIAKAYKVTILDIDRENAIPAGGIQAGQVLKIPAVTALTIIEEKDPQSVQAETTRPVAQDNNTVKPLEVEYTEEKPAPVTQAQPEAKTVSETKTKPEEKPQTETKPQSGVQQATTSASKSGVKEKPAQPQKKKVHKVQKGETLADIAKKYSITVQELKQANKGVIFAMPDMRLVIPVKDE